MHDDRFDWIARRLAGASGRRAVAATGLLAILGLRPSAAAPVAERTASPDASPRGAAIERKCRPVDATAVRRHIKAAAKKYGQPYKKMLCVAQCESGLANCAVNKQGETYGVFQFKTATWKSTKYANKDLWDPKWNALATAWMWKEGRENEWDCCCPKFKCNCPGKRPSWC